MSQELQTAVNNISDSLKAVHGQSSLEPESQGEVPQRQEDIDALERRKRRKTRSTMQNQMQLAYARGLQEAERSKNAAINYANLKAQEAAVSQQLAAENYEQSLDVKEATLKKLLTDAIENGESDKQVEYQTALSKLTADRATHETLKQTHAQTQQANEQRYFQDIPSLPPTDAFDWNLPQSQSHQEDMPNHMAAWLERNPWCDPEHPNFDAELASEAVHVSREVEKHLKFNGRGDVIQTPEFLHVVENVLKEKYGSQNNETETNFAPVSRGPLSTELSAPRSKVHLNADERALAHKLPLNHPDGRAYSPAEKELMYAKQKVRFAR